MLPTALIIPSASVGEMPRVVAAGFLLAFAFVPALTCYGLWSFREWGRMLCIVLSCLAILLSLPSLLFDFSFYVGGFQKVGYRAIRLAIDILIVWYLGQPHTSRNSSIRQ
jgi:uncharacterized membrane protein (DUF2068 family)